MNQESTTPAPDAEPRLIWWLDQPATVRICEIPICQALLSARLRALVEDRYGRPGRRRLWMDAAVAIPPLASMPDELYVSAGIINEAGPDDFAGLVITLEEAPLCSLLGGVITRPDLSAPYLSSELSRAGYTDALMGHDFYDLVPKDYSLATLAHYALGFSQGVRDR